MMIASVIPALGRQRQENKEFLASLNYITSSRLDSYMRPCLKRNKNKMRIELAKGMSQWERVIAAKPENPSSIPRTSIKVERREPATASCLLMTKHTSWIAHTLPTHM